MRATRLRLRFVTGITLTAATYGSATYGSQTYGQRATDPVSSYVYRIIPLPAGGPVDPSWMYREGDNWPDFQAQILADIGPLDLTAVASANIVLSPIDGREDMTPSLYPVTVVDPPAKGRIERVWQTSDLIDPGVYRLAVRFLMTSGRYLTLPGTDNVRFVVTTGLIGVHG